MDIFPSQSFELRVSDSPESLSRRVASHVSDAPTLWRREAGKEFLGSVSLDGFRLSFGRYVRRPAVLLVGRFTRKPEGTRVYVRVRPPFNRYVMWLVGVAALAALPWLIAQRVALPHGGLQEMLEELPVVAWIGQKVGMASLAALLCVWSFSTDLLQFLWQRGNVVETIVRVLLDTPTPRR
jgi:hypothetical protein